MCYAFLLSACGPGSGTGPAHPTDSGTPFTPDAGTGGADGGVEPDAGAPDLPDAGSGISETDGGVEPDAGTPEAPDAGSGGSETDGGTVGTDGGTASADPCEGLHPRAVFPPTTYTDEQHDAACLAGTSDGAGGLLLMMGTSEADVGAFVSASGSLRSFGAAPVQPIGELGTFEGIVAPSAESWLAAFDEDGSALRTFPAQDSSWPRFLAQANDPLGGMVAIGQAMSGSLTLYSFDDHLDPRWSQPIDATKVLALGVDRAGQTLVLFDGTSPPGEVSMAGQWFNHEGAPGPVFTAWSASPSGPFELYEQVGAGLFLREGAGDEWTWVRAFRSGEAASSAAPGWLVDRPGTSLHMAFGGKAYAVIPDPGASAATCQQSVEIAAPDGTSCGSSTFTVGTESCRTSDLRVGYDGTVVQTLPEPYIQCGATASVCHCTWQWWPGFYGAGH
jgi:hypothetical protein